MKEDVSWIIANSGAKRCVECGKCVAVCPMFAMYPNFSYDISPRGMIKKAMMDADLLHDKAIWFCTECNACTDTCPEGVSCRNLLAGFREQAVRAGLVEHGFFCSQCGRLFLPSYVMEYLKEILRDSSGEFLTICPSCRRLEYGRRNA